MYKHTIHRIQQPEITLCVTIWSLLVITCEYTEHSGIRSWAVPLKVRRRPCLPAFTDRFPSLPFPCPWGRAIVRVIGPSSQRSIGVGVHRGFFKRLSFDLSHLLFGFLTRWSSGISTSRGSGWASAPNGDVSLSWLRFKVCLSMGSKVCVLCVCEHSLYKYKSDVS
jgi:hypothetical protein